VEEEEEEEERLYIGARSHSFFGSFGQSGREETKKQKQ